MQSFSHLTLTDPHQLGDVGQLVERDAELVGQEDQGLLEPLHDQDKVQLAVQLGDLPEDGRPVGHLVVWEAEVVQLAVPPLVDTH